MTSSQRAPFDADAQLYHKLTTVMASQHGAGPPRMVLHRVPDPGGSPSTKSTTPKDYLPGVPRVKLLSPDLGAFLARELLTDDLNRLAPYLWLVATQDSAHISPLTEQLVRGRRITVAERPALHLVWYYDRVFVKPLPKYLLSHAFWAFLRADASSSLPAPLRAQLLQHALGFARSYAYLIQHRSDFALAVDARLLPKGVRFAEFSALMAAVGAAVRDEDVAPRYRFGELRLSRLNFWAKVVLRRFAYHKTSDQYAAYFARFFGPILFVFAVVSVLLSAMQVVLAAQPLMGTESGAWAVFAAVARGFAVFTLVAALGTLAALLLVLVAMVLREALFASKDLYRKRRRTSSQIG